MYAKPNLQPVWNHTAQRRDLLCLDVGGTWRRVGSDGQLHVIDEDHYLHPGGAGVPPVAQPGGARRDVRAALAVPTPAPSQIGWMSFTDVCAELIRVNAWLDAYGHAGREAPLGASQVSETSQTSEMNSTSQSGPTGRSGRERLCAWLTAHDLNAVTAMAVLHYAGSRITAWMNGLETPSAAERLAIERATCGAVPHEAW
jgi:hypothetical protein